MTAYDIFSQFRQRAIHTRDLGDKFERFFKKYLLTDPQYADRFAQVWLWMEFPYRDGKIDTGIDIVAQEKHTGDFWAIQCKFFDENSTLSKHDIDSFLSASGKKFDVAGNLVQYSQRMIVSTTDNWGKNAEEAIANQTIPVLRLRLEDLANAPIEWDKFSIDTPEVLTTTKKNTLRPHQKAALSQVLEGFSNADRGKLVMACGTGKTFTSLKITEEITKGRGTVLFLVPSISLLSQSLREWTSQVSSGIDFHAICVCSDTAASRKTNEDMSVVDLALPATTDPDEIRRQYQGYITGQRHPLIVVFSTYQSITKVAEAQKLQAFGEFDLIICDEAHRTTGITLANSDESSFVKVHDNSFIKSIKRLYMTATPRIYSESSKNKAAEADATLSSMDDEQTFGKEFHRLGFGEAVGLGLLSDYKVLVLAVDEKYIHRTFQKQITDDDDELKLDDAVKIVGCWNGLSKRFIQSDEPEQADIDRIPMKRAVAFCNTIKASKTITRLFTSLITDYQQEHGIDQNLVSCEVQHVDGTYNSLVRNERIDWLKAPVAENSCKILSNARCLAEGVDVPALDAVMFLNPRNSVVDVVQSVGRVMRKAENKNYGYIILPVGIPTGEDPTEALNNNKKYKIVWDVLQALRSHDDRFNSTINKIELNKKKPPQISVVGIGTDSDDEGNDGNIPPKQIEMNFPNLEEWRDAIYARIVAKCGDRRYWEKWGHDVANIAKRVAERINILIERDGEHKAAFREFLKGLRTTINPFVSEDEAIEMLAQHNITKPIFEALFENYSFTTNNPVSVAMEKIQNLLNKAAIEKETESLEKFYDSVRLRASKIDNGVGRQKVIVELYDKFFRSAFPRTVEKLGIVYTPVEVVDFINHSVSDVLQKEFNLTLSDESIHILDGFTGTGTFITRLLQSGLIDQNSLRRKYQNEIYANEIVLLAYYIAAINIENVFHDLTQHNEYVPFEGICLTDTFQLGEEKSSLDKAFPENSRSLTNRVGGIANNNSDRRFLLSLDSPAIFGESFI